MPSRPKATRNIIDRVVAYFAPAAGLERARARTTLESAFGPGGWKGGRRDRRPTRNWRPWGGSPDADSLPDLPELRTRARDLARNAPIATGAVATTVTGVLGDGLQLQASIDGELLGLTDDEADQAEREQEREFAIFAKRCDFTRVQVLDELQRLSYRAVKESGDVLIIRRYRKDAGDVYGTKLQVLEADRLSNPGRQIDGVEGTAGRIAGGVETDIDGVPQAYHISNRHPGALLVPGLTWERVPSRTADGVATVIHLFDRSRPELTRGTPFLAPVIEHLKQISDYSDAEVTAAVIGAMFTLAIETSADENDQPVIGEKTKSTGDNEVELGNGAVISLAPGEKATPVNPARPNANFDPFMTAFLRQVGVALELPYEMLVKHFTASYSASRAALEMSWQSFSRERAWFGARFCQEIYGWAMDEAVAMGRLVRPGWFNDPLVREAWLGAEWIGPRRFSLNPYQEAEADRIDMLSGVKTGEQVCIERTGGEIEKKMAQASKEQKLRIAAGLSVDSAALPSPGQQNRDPNAPQNQPDQTPQEGTAA